VPVHGSGVNDHGVVIAAGRWGRPCGGAIGERGEGAERRNRAAEAVIGGDRGKRGRKRGDAGLILRIGDHQLRRTVGENIGDLGGREPPVHRQQDGAKPGGGAVEIDEFERVARQHGDAIAALDTGLRQTRRQPLHAGEMLAVADAQALAEEGGALAEDRRVAPEDVRDRDAAQAHGRELLLRR
jgi:hypothetical protein